MRHYHTYTFKLISDFAIDRLYIEVSDGINEKYIEIQDRKEASKFYYDVLQPLINELDAMAALKEKESEMTKLTTKKRNKLPKSAFAEPGERKFPVEDAAHAKNAKSRATQMVNKGKLSSSEASKIKAKANRMLGKNKKAAKAK